MGKRGQATLKTFLAAAFGVAAGGALLLDRGGLIGSAQAEDQDDRKQRREQEKQAPARPQVVQPPRANVPPPSPQRLPQPERPAQQYQKPQPQFQRQLPPEKPAQFQRQVPSEKPAQFQRSPSAEPLPPKPAGTPPPELRKEGIKRLPPPSGQQGVAPPPGQGLPPPGFQKPPAAVAKPPPSGPGFVTPPAAVAKPPPSGPGFVTPPAAGAKPPPSGPAIVTPPAPRVLVPQGAAIKRFEEVQKGRQVRVEDGGRRKVIEEPGNRFIVRENNRAIIRHDEGERFLRRPGAQAQRRPDGGTETFYVRPDGVRIVSVVDGNGRLLRRFRRDRDGREYNIIDNRRFYRNVAIGVGVGVLGIVALNLAMPRVTIPYDRYIVDYDRASDDDLYDTLYAPPIEDLDRPYSLDEIRYNYELRARVRSIDLDTITFDFGAWEVPPDQYYKLERAARAIQRVLQDNAEAVFLIEGHTDAVGSDEDNLSLSDRRAQSVAEILSETFGVPPENLVTQGYGEQYLKVETQAPEPRNRRVSIRNITGLMAER